MRSPVGDVTTSDLKKSITRESIDNLLPTLGIGLTISGVTTSFVTNTVGVATLTFHENHNFNGIVTYSALTGGSGYTNGTYHNVKLFNNGTSTWDGATARVVVASGAVSNVDITSGGSGYTNNEELDFDTSRVGGGTGAGVTITTSGISTVIGNTIQLTGIGTHTSGHFRITGVPAKNQVAIAISNTDARPIQGQYLINIAPEITVSTATTTITSGITTFTTTEPHGFVVGNRLTIKNSSDANLGNYDVTGVTTTTVTANVGVGVTIHGPKFLLKHGLSANDLTSDKNGENLGSRGLSFFGNETAILQSNISNETTIRVKTTNVGVATAARFELGSYFQVDNEIMRVTSNVLSGSGGNEMTVIRGAMGTVKENHSGGALIKKVELKAIEFHRPSYLRASGHTFEYLGYGPGNYSTALPQVQVRSLNEEEETLAQAQEKNCGIVVYTGMNNDGDFYIGNKKINSATGKEKTFDIPIPTVTGEDTSVNSVVFDEVIVKERLIVEGGNSGTVLSQFDGPVTFNGETKFNEDIDVDASVKVTGVFNITDTTQSTSVGTGALTVDGGVGIDKNLHVGGDITATNFYGNGSTLSGISTTILYDTNDAVRVEGTTTGATVTGVLDVNGSADIDNVNINGNTVTTTTGNLTLDSDGGTLDVNDNLDVSGTGAFGSNLTVSGSGTFTGDLIAFSSSDQRLKDNVEPIEDAIAKVLSLSGNTFEWNDKSDKEGLDIGVIAQEVAGLDLPGLYTTREDGYMAVRYEKLVPLLIEAIKQLNAKVDEHHK